MELSTVINILINCNFNHEIEENLTNIMGEQWGRYLKCIQLNIIYQGHRNVTDDMVKNYAKYSNLLS